MNKEQLLELINSKIAGQGSAVDIGGALAPVLAELVTNLANVPTTYIAQVSSLEEIEIPEDILDSIQTGDRLIIKVNKEKPTTMEMGIPTSVTVGNVGGIKAVAVQYFAQEDTYIHFVCVQAMKHQETGWNQSVRSGDATIS